MPYRLFLIAAFMIYSSAGVFMKLASMHEPFGRPYFIYLALAFLMLGTYAVMWQFALKRIPLAQAFLFKSMTIVFSLFFAWAIFNEHISFNNIMGSLIIFAGVVLNSYRFAA